MPSLGFVIPQTPRDDQGSISFQADRPTYSDRVLTRILTNILTSQDLNRHKEGVGYVGETTASCSRELCECGQLGARRALRPERPGRLAATAVAALPHLVHVHGHVHALAVAPVPADPAELRLAVLPRVAGGLPVPLEVLERAASLAASDRAARLVVDVRVEVGVGVAACHALLRARVFLGSLWGLGNEFWGHVANSGSIGEFWGRNCGVGWGGDEPGSASGER